MTSSMRHQLAALRRQTQGTIEDVGVLGDTWHIPLATIRCYRIETPARRLGCMQAQLIVQRCKLELLRGRPESTGRERRQEPRLIAGLEARWCSAFNRRR